MKNGYSSNFKVCVTCNYWMGVRSTNISRNRAEYDSGATGDCHEGGMLKKSKPANATCSKWQKWGGIK